jgi:hypothetical protein
VIRDYDASRLATAGLKRAERGLQASLGLIAPGSPARAPARARLRAIGAGRAGEGPWAR